MKIAFVADDQQTISQHFGRAEYYLVIAIEDGQESGRELRAKLGHRQFSQEPGDHDHHHEDPDHHGAGGGHGSDPASHNRHGRMAEAISDCEVVICAGMGMGAYTSLQSFKIRPIITDMHQIDQALQAYLDGTLEDKPERLH